MTDDSRTPSESEPSGDIAKAESTTPSDGKNPTSRPFSLYAVLGLGVGALLILLAIIYFSSMDRDNPDQPICTSISPADAQQAVLDGEIDNVVVNYNSDVESSTDPRWGPVLSRIDYVDGRCGNLPQGIEQRDAITLVLGTIYLYNETTNQPQIAIKLVGSDSLDASLFTTPTLVPTVTPIPTETPTVGVTPTEEPATPVFPTEVPTEPAPVVTPIPTRSTPDSSPVASPETTRSAVTPRPTPSATARP